MATIQEALELARQHLAAGRPEMAEQLCQKIVDVEPAEARAWHVYGLAVLRRGDPHRAVAFVSRAIAFQPNVAEYYFSLGLALAAQDRLSDAEQCFRQALVHRPDFAEAEDHLHQLLARSMYPLCIPLARVQPGLDFLLVQLPPFDGMIPNGLAYVHNALQRSGVRCQTLDMNLLVCHRFHQRLGMGQVTKLMFDEYELSQLWGLEDHSPWERPEVQNYFWDEIGDLLRQIAAVRPKAVGLSVQANNRPVCKRFVRELRTLAPDVLVVVGGYDCAHRETGPWLFPDFDYMAIFEADLTIGPLAQAIARGERPKDLPGIVSRFDSPDRVWEDAPLLEDLDAIDHPRYQWVNPQLYQILCRHPQNVVPISASRGCKWGRCRFCAECFPFRQRSPRTVADEIEEWTHRGARLFYFFESDVNGDLAALDELCRELIRRNLPAALSAQLRIDHRCTLEHFRRMRQAGFARVRFGVDGWSDRTLQLQRKGYTMAHVADNLRDCRAAELMAEVNLVVGVPGETEQDVDDSIANLIAYREYYSTVEYMNPLQLRCGSEYFRHPEQYKIHFRADRDTLIRDYGGYVPQDLWYSEEPYIDHQVRLARMERICTALKAGGGKIAGPALATAEKFRQPGAYFHESGEVRVRAVV
jgi:tetratricopeptide (TPR) repeat protein